MIIFIKVFFVAMLSIVLTDAKSWDVTLDKGKNKCSEVKLYMSQCSIHGVQMYMYVRPDLGKIEILITTICVKYHVELKFLYN